VDKLSRNRRRISVLFPLFSLLLALAVINFLPRWLDPPPPTAAIRPTGTLPPNWTPGQPTAIATAIPGTPSTPIPPTATPTLPPNAEITLFGPPGDGRFFADETISFFWDWPLPLAENQMFVVVIILDGGEWAMGEIDEPNFGSQYRLSGNLANMGVAETAVSAAWEVRLIHQPTGEILRRSPSRPITALPGQ